jgi:hypothetical protein
MLDSSEERRAQTGCCAGSLIGRKQIFYRQRSPSNGWYVIWGYPAVAEECAGVKSSRRVDEALDGNICVPQWERQLGDPLSWPRRGMAVWFAG